MKTRHLSIDIETFSSVSLFDCGLYAYAESEDFEVLLFAYSYDFGEVEIIDLAKGETIPDNVLEDLNSVAVIKHAYNAPFEIVCLTSAGYKTSADQWRCTMFHSLYLGYPAGLAKTGDVIGLPGKFKKNAAGNRLIKYFSVPCKPTRTNGQRTRNLPEHDPDKWDQFVDYCRQDVVAEMEIYKRLKLFPVPESEQELWLIEQRYHKYGIPIDIELVNGALAIREKQELDLMAEAKELTELKNPNSIAQLRPWIEEKLGEEVPNLQKATVDELIEENKNPDVTRALEIRQELSKSSIAKYTAFYNGASKDHRIHGAHQIYGANRTGRWAGRLIQPQNMPRNYIPSIDLARDYAKSANLDALTFTWGNASDVLSQLLRTVMLPSEGRKLIVADFASIEARVIAWLAGEEWVNRVFAGDGRIYEATAAKMFDVPVEKIVKGNPEYALRTKGKIATLALGYQGSVGALKSLGALNMGLEEKELPGIVSMWRESNKNIVQLWYDLDETAIATVHDGIDRTSHGLIFRREGEAIFGQDFLTIELPSKRKLYYVKPNLQESKFGYAVHYQEARSNGMQSEQTYGGKIAENVTQAIARDCLAETIKRIDKKGWQIIMHIHDEVVIDADQKLTVEEVCELMAEPIDWAPGLILGADGFETEFYRKD